MGPQHPFLTHGVLRRLILEIDGETVTKARAGIGYLHTGIEKNMEYRTWRQGVTFCTRMDYLTPMFQETAYCLGIEKLLGITDQIPERANVIRVLMMEMTRNQQSPHLPRHGRHGDGCDDRHDGRLPRARAPAPRHRDDHRPADEQRLHPSRRRRPGPPPGSIDALREMVPEVRRGLGELEALLNENPILKGRTVNVGVLNLAGCMALGITGPVLRSTGLPHDLRKLDPYCGYETYDFEVKTRTSKDAYGRLRIRIDEMYESLKIIEQCTDRLQDNEAATRSWSRTRRWPRRRSWPSAATASATASTTSARSWAARWSRSSTTSSS